MFLTTIKWNFQKRKNEMELVLQSFLREGQCVSYSVVLESHKNKNEPVIQTGILIRKTVSW